jgi:hypothetical protein
VLGNLHGALPSVRWRRVLCFCETLKNPVAEQKHLGCSVLKLHLFVAAESKGWMNTKILTETSNIKDVESILVDIARRLYARQLIGKAIIITEHPRAAHAIIRKHWQRMTRQHLRDRTLTLDTVLINDLTNTIATMQSLRFTALAPFEDPTNDVFLLHPTSLGDILPEAATIFVTCTVDTDLLDAATRCMPQNGLIVRYM